jgi:hypothetical protein
VYSVRTPGDLYYATELGHPPGDDGVDVSYVFTRATPEDGLVPPRRIQVDDLLAGASRGCNQHVSCGPTAFVEAW